MATDLQVILPKLVRSGLWSAKANLCRYKHVVLDANSIATHLYRLCIADQVRRQRSLLSSNQVPDIYSASLVNWSDYCHRIEQLFLFMSDHQIEPILVYAGKEHESNLYGPVVAQVGSNTQKVNYRLSAIVNYDKDRSSIDVRFNLPPLAMNLFKLVVNRLLRPTIKLIFQAYYDPFAWMTKLARDFACPVLTNECDFLLMGVRAGFILFDDFWLHHIELHTLATTQVISHEQKSVIKVEKSPTRAALQVNCTFHYNRLFLRQHPGLLPETSIYLFPLGSSDFVTTHAAQLKRLRLFEVPSSKLDYLARPMTLDPPRRNKSLYEKYHKAAKRLDAAIHYLCQKDAIVLRSLFTGDPSAPTDTKVNFHADFRSLTSKYVVVHDFRHSLRWILKKSLSKKEAASQLNYIQERLTRGECTASFLLNLLYCSVGRMTSKTFNSQLAYEDLAIKKSAHSVGDRANSMFMSLYNPSLKVNGVGSQASPVSAKYYPGKLITIDRKGSALAETLVDNRSHCDGSQLNPIRDLLALEKLATSKQGDNTTSVAAAKFINQVFMTSDLRQMPEKLSESLSALDKEIKLELAILRSALRFCLQKASTEDNHFKRAYLKLGHDIEVALVNHYIYINGQFVAGSTKKSDPLVALIQKRDLENVALPVVANNPTGPASKDHHSTGGLSQIASKAPKSQQSTKLGKSTTTTNSSSSSSPAASKPTAATVAIKSSQTMDSSSSPMVAAGASNCSRKIRHLIEMLNVALGIYLELNTFFNYPLPRLQNLTKHYNPVLLYNLTLLSDDKALFKF